MTGAYVRVKRDEKWESIEIDQLSDEELEMFFAEETNPKRWAMFLAKWIRDNIREE